MKARYIRVSTKNQNTARQEAKQHPDETMFIDVISGTVPFNERPQAKQLLFHIVMGDVEQISVSSIDRLGRNTLNILQTIEHFRKHGINLHVDNLGLDSITADGKPNHIFQLITSVMASLSQMEREQLRERQLEGIAEAKKAGTYKGREKGSTETPEQFLSKHKSIVKALKNNPTLSLGKIAKLAADGDYQPSPNTVRKVKQMLE